MAIVINGSGTVTGISVGGLPDAIVDAGTLASGINKTSISDSGNATAITIDSSENVGIGVTPESWKDTWNTLQLGDGASIGGRTTAGNVDIASNCYRDSVNNRWEYIGTNGSEEAAKYTQFSGQHVFYVGAAGDADVEVDWDTPMTIENGGIVKFDDYGGTTGKGRIEFGNSGEQFIEGFDTGNAGSSSYLKFGYASTTAMTIDNSGNVDIASTVNPRGVKLYTKGNVDIMDGSLVFAKPDSGTYNWRVLPNNINVGDLTFQVTTDTNTSETTQASTWATKLQFTRDGNVNVKAGNLIIGLAGMGIDFSAVDDGGISTPNELLDDYEQGAWSPTWNSEGGTITTNTTYTKGRYIKIGNLVTVWIRLYSNSVSSPTGIVTIGGLPYTIKDELGSGTASTIFQLNAITGTLSGTPMMALQRDTTTLILFDKVWDSTEFSGDIADHFDTDVWGYGTISYEAA